MALSERIEEKSQAIGHVVVPRHELEDRVNVLSFCPSVLDGLVELVQLEVIGELRQSGPQDNSEGLTRH